MGWSNFTPFRNGYRDNPMKVYQYRLGRGLLGVRPSYKIVVEGLKTYAVVNRINDKGNEKYSAELRDYVGMFIRHAGTYRTLKDAKAAMVDQLQNMLKK